TTAKPLPCSPARLASMAALSASRFDWSARSLTLAMISPICWVCSDSARMFSAIDSTRCRISAMPSVALPTATTPARAAWLACCAACESTVAMWAAWSAEAFTSSTVALVSASAADCSVAPEDCCDTADRISDVDEGKELPPCLQVRRERLSPRAEPALLLRREVGRGIRFHPVVDLFQPACLVGPDLRPPRGVGDVVGQLTEPQLEQRFLDVGK